MEIQVYETKKEIIGCLFEVLEDALIAHNVEFPLIIFGILKIKQSLKNGKHGEIQGLHSDENDRLRNKFQRYLLIKYLQKQKKEKSITLENNYTSIVGKTWEDAKNQLINETVKALIESEIRQLSDITESIWTYNDHYDFEEIYFSESWCKIINEEIESKLDEYWLQRDREDKIEHAKYQKEESDIYNQYVSDII